MREAACKLRYRGKLMLETSYNFFTMQYNMCNYIILFYYN